MRRMSIKPGAGSRALAAVCLLTGLVVTSCQKEAAKPGNNNTKVKKNLTVSMDSDESVTAQISTFYNDVKRVHAGTMVDKAYTPEDLNFLIEGAYNMMAATVSHDREEYTSFSIEAGAAKNADGKIDVAQAAQAFYELRDKLVSFEASLNGSNKTLAHFDLEVEDRDGGVVFKGTGDFAAGLAEVLACDDSLSGPANRGYLLESGWKDYNSPLYPNAYLNGQCDINTAAKTASNRVYNQQGAARMIIKYALNKRMGCIQQYQCGYYALVSTKIWAAPLPIASPVSQYAALGISGGYAANKKQVDIAESYLSPTVSGDPDSVFKRWLTRPMVNFYIRRMPDFFDETIYSSGDPTNAKIYSFNIETWQNLVHQVLPADNPGGFPTNYAQNRVNNYIIRTAKFVKLPCNQVNKIGLSAL